MYQKNTKVLWNTHLISAYHRVGIECAGGFAGAMPGQFVLVGFPGQIDPLLRRPFSIHGIIREDGAIRGIEILYKVVGRCTEELSRLREDDMVSLHGPLGNGFEISQEPRRIFIVAGGIGVAPMALVAEYLNENAPGLLSNSAVFLGGRSSSDLLCAEKFARFDMDIILVTEDGSAGKEGLVTGPLSAGIGENPPGMIFACGPIPMLRAVAGIAKENGIPCQVSIETVMACGMGACLGCAVGNAEKPDTYLHVCGDGPVFDASCLRFDAMSMS